MLPVKITNTPFVKIDSSDTEDSLKFYDSPIFLNNLITSKPKSINIDYSFPQVSFDNSYEKDPRIIDRVVNFFYYYTLLYTFFIYK